MNDDDDDDDSLRFFIFAFISLFYDFFVVVFFSTHVTYVFIYTCNLSSDLVTFVLVTIKSFQIGFELSF